MSNFVEQREQTGKRIVQLLNRLMFDMETLFLKKKAIHQLSEDFKNNVWSEKHEEMIKELEGYMR